MEFYRRHLCRLSSWPEELHRTLELGAERPVYAYMNGPSEFTITGTIRDIDLSGELGRIRLPALVLGGRYDEVTPKLAEQIRAGIPGARGVTFERSSHLPFWEERELFMDVVADFLSGVDRASVPGTSSASGPRP
jgi:proline iminopeptidase